MRRPPRFDKIESGSSAINIMYLIDITLLDKTGDAATIPGAAKPAAEPEAEPKPEPPHAVILHNDEVNSFEFVVWVLMCVFGYNPFKAIYLTWKTQSAGKYPIWSGKKSEAEEKANKMRAFGPDPLMKAIAKGAARPLTVTVEQLPG